MISDLRSNHYRISVFAYCRHITVSESVPTLSQTNIVIFSISNKISKTDEIFEVIYSIIGHRFRYQNIKLMFKQYQCLQDCKFSIFRPSKCKISVSGNIPAFRNTPTYTQ